MDRGRCGLDLESNRFLREQKLTRKRSDHLARLQQIKTRKAGTSSTLDNTPPECMFLDRFKSDPRKASKKKAQNNIIERENKVLLQRISHILTAPPKITDASYLAMKKLLSTLGDTNSFNLALKKKYNDQFFERVHKTTPYYSHKKWEADYAEQLRGQKFMRQVNYSRPADWVDPFQERPAQEDYDQARARRRQERLAGSRATGGACSGGGDGDSDEPDAFGRSTGDLTGLLQQEQDQEQQEGKPGKSKDKGQESKAGHVAQVKRLRASKSNPSPRRKEAFSKDNSSSKEMKAKSAASSSGLPSSSCSAPSASLEPEQSSALPFSQRVLAQCERLVSLHSPASLRAQQALEREGRQGQGQGQPQGQGQEQGQEQVQACVLCSLVEGAYLYITVDGVEARLHAEALVHVSALFLSEEESAAGKTQAHFPLHDQGAQELLAMEIVEHVSVLKTGKDKDKDKDKDRGVYCQVMLPWAGAWTGGSGQASLNSTRQRGSSAHIEAAALDMTSVMNSLEDQGQTRLEVEDPYYRGEEEREPPADLGACFDPISVSCGVRAVLSCGVEPDDVASRLRARKKKAALGISEFSPEEVFALVRVTREGEERARVVLHSLRDSVNLFKKEPALPANSRLELLISLPSVLTVESDLMEDYFRNAAANIRAEHDQETGRNTLVLG